MSPKVLIVEDEQVLLETLAYNLHKEGYTVKSADSGEDGLDLAREWMPDLILLDVMLPGMDGFEVCKRIRQEQDTPLLLLTARADEIDRVIGFEIGADDYITKPFSMRELLARVKTRLKAYQKFQEKRKSEIDFSSEEEITTGNLVIDQKRQEIRLRGKVLELKPKEKDLLCYLVEHKGRAVTREAILENVWGWDYIGESRTVDVHIRWLRSKIEEVPSKPVRLVTVPGVGYRFDG
jgi:DNA-binding response OmpR family regulator